MILVLNQSGRVAGLKSGKKDSRFPGLVIRVEHEGIQRSLDFMARHYCQPIQICDLADASGLSRRGFIKAFRRIVSANPGELLRYLRIEHAKSLLVRHDLKLSQIAGLCGYRSVNSFCVAFQRVVKIAPKKYQREHLLTAPARNGRPLSGRPPKIVRPNGDDLGRGDFRVDGNGLGLKKFSAVKQPTKIPQNSSYVKRHRPLHQSRTAQGSRRNGTWR